MALILWDRHEIFNFIHAGAFFRHNAKRLQVAITQGKHLAAREIFLNHANIFIRNEEQIHIERFAVILDLYEFHAVFSFFGTPL